MWQKKDLISRLPECIIHHIMSYLPTEDLLQTTFLSRRWYSMKKNCPLLDFDQEYFLENLEQKTPEFRKFLKLYRKHVDKSLHHFSQNKLCLQACRFCITYRYKKLFSDLDRWIGLALENKVKRLDLVGLSLSYTLPLPVFSSKTLTILHLCWCSLDQPLSLFSSIKQLYLSHCHINGDIVLKPGDCPALEDLTLNECWGFNCVHISNLLRLHMVEVKLVYSDEFFETLEIASQIITSFTIRVEEDLPWSVINMDGLHLPHLKSLHLNSMLITDQEFHTFLSKLPLLEKLYLFNCYQLKTMKISSPSLNTLMVCCCPDIIELDSPNLKNFIFIYDEEKEKLNCEIMVADCTCHSLETLILFDELITDGMLHRLISKFPLLQNLWIIGCHELKRIKVPNLQLKRLHIVRCFQLKAVDVDSPNLSELSYTLPEKLELSVADHMYASGGLRFEHEVDSTSSFWSRRLKELLAHFIKDETLISILVDAVYVDYPSHSLLSLGNSRVN